LQELARKEDTKVGLGLVAVGVVLLLGGSYLAIRYIEGQRAMAALGTSSRVVGRGLSYVLLSLGFGVVALVSGARKLWQRGQLD